MVFSKISNQSQNLKSEFTLENNLDHGQFFLNELSKQLKLDCSYLSQPPKTKQSDFFNKIRILDGFFHSQSSQNKNTMTKNYLFLQLPNVAGFLIELECGNDIYKMLRATKVNPVLNAELGGANFAQLFILKSEILEEFRVLDPCFVRTKNSDKTLSVKQMSEMLLLLAESVRI